MGDVLHYAGRGREGYSDWQAGPLLTGWKSSAFDQGRPFFAAPFLSQPDPNRPSPLNVIQLAHTREQRGRFSISHDAVLRNRSRSSLTKCAKDRYLSEARRFENEGGTKFLRDKESARLAGH
jgi:hypothetical protein